MENKLAIEIAPLAQQDLRAIAEIHVRSWQQAYRGQVAQDYLDNLDIARQLERWQKIFVYERSNPVCGTWVAHQAGKQIGFLSYGPARDEDRKEWMEIYAVYVLPEYWSSGAGYALFAKAKAHFVRDKFSHVYLWVLAENHLALNAYRRWGGNAEPGRTKLTDVGDERLKEVSVAFAL